MRPGCSFRPGGGATSRDDSVIFDAVAEEKRVGVHPAAEDWPGVHAAAAKDRAGVHAAAETDG